MTATIFDTHQAVRRLEVAGIQRHGGARVGRLAGKSASGLPARVRETRGHPGRALVCGSWRRSGRNGAPAWNDRRPGAGASPHGECPRRSARAALSGACPAASQPHRVHARAKEEGAVGLPGRVAGGKAQRAGQLAAVDEEPGEEDQASVSGGGGSPVFSRPRRGRSISPPNRGRRPAAPHLRVRPERAERGGQGGDMVRTPHTLPSTKGRTSRCVPWRSGPSGRLRRGTARRRGDGTASAGRHAARRRPRPPGPEGPPARRRVHNALATDSGSTSLTNLTYTLVPRGRDAGRRRPRPRRLRDRRRGARTGPAAGTWLRGDRGAMHSRREILTKWKAVSVLHGPCVPGGGCLGRC